MSRLKNHKQNGGKVGRAKKLVDGLFDLALTPCVPEEKKRQRRQEDPQRVREEAQRVFDELSNSFDAHTAAAGRLSERIVERGPPALAPAGCELG